MHCARGIAAIRDRLNFKRVICERCFYISKNFIVENHNNELACQVIHFKLTMVCQLNVDANFKLSSAGEGLNFRIEPTQ